MVQDNNTLIVYRWLLLGTILIAIMISIGGYTRLTKSGLSMTDWRPVTGTIPPLSEQEWIEEYNHHETIKMKMIA